MMRCGFNCCCCGCESQSEVHCDKRDYATSPTSTRLRGEEHKTHLQTGNLSYSGSIGGWADNSLVAMNNGRVCLPITIKQRESPMITQPATMLAFFRCKAQMVHERNFNGKGMK